MLESRVHMYRTFVILRHTFLEAVVQPIYSLLLLVGAVVLLIFTLLPFFTLGEDTTMFKSVGLDVILVLVLIATLFATSKSIFDEIEDRTMLTLMSKPVRKWEVLVGKYLGILLAAGLAVAALGAVLTLCTWLRIPRDYTLNPNSLDERDRQMLLDTRLGHIAGLPPSLVLIWMQIGVLAAVGVAISTRVSLVVNLPAVILIYLAGNLLRFVFPLDAGPLKDRPIAKGVAYVLGTLLPYLENFDLQKRTVFAKPVWGVAALGDPNAIHLGAVWGYTAGAAVYAACYATFALAFGMLLFQNRELGGGES